SRLPDKYRAALILCYLQGKTNDEAAEQLGCSRGGIAGVLSRARDLLRDRLVRRGLTLSGAVLGTLLTQAAASAAVPAALVSSTVKVVPVAAAGKVVVAGAASTQASALVDATLKALTWAKVKFWAALTVVTVGVAVPVILLSLPKQAPTLRASFK